MLRTICFGLASVLWLSACATGPAPEDAPRPPPMDAPGNSDRCDASGLQGYLGRTHSEALNQALASQSDASEVRVIEPGEGFTLDYRQTRLNIYLDEEGRISDLRCG
ncbi:Peptidase inhibitor I78 family protein [Modicisalibacter ilicicola DSM 19980]|uniref:Peptidase inhibitor I78 family protein n=1 Tax=Modicisalibacter ilicicola DSM 19980 TaxID=1121942 RepID=A0A1M5B6G9_9GAMM|nr:I78 family peptidase inhibitor [Halomonas ilicicola]SHF37887.1 Peptidase inhibitor I78 family protein [Halomonas ilicicola DSM 19980]